MEIAAGYPLFASVHTPLLYLGLSQTTRVRGKQVSELSLTPLLLSLPLLWTDHKNCRKDVVTRKDV